MTSSPDRIRAEFPGISTRGDTVAKLGKRSATDGPARVDLQRVISQATTMSTSRATRAS
ncbi:hypothetical protein [Nocardia abscessus]|uniref:hypothetical protein n=1 Tax=Nocardia abscessus TaxID=120957 RepID=UPI002457F071|nr:hypothetical protein [Nocardia abscessus]